MWAKHNQRYAYNSNKIVLIDIKFIHSSQKNFRLFGICLFNKISTPMHVINPGP